MPVCGGSIGTRTAEHRVESQSGISIGLKRSTEAVRFTEIASDIEAAK